MGGVPRFEEERKAKRLCMCVFKYIEGFVNEYGILLKNETRV